MKRGSPGVSLLSGVVILSVALCLTSCRGMNYGGNNSGGYYDPYGGRDRYDRDDYYYDRDRRDAYEERKRLERERERLERERERLEREREKAKRRPKRPKRERCPAGWHPSEQKCTSKERRKGCQDMRTPGGLGCVRGR